MWFSTIAVSVLSPLWTWVLTAVDWRRNFSLVAVWGKCNVWALFWRLWTPCKHRYYTVSSILFASLVPPSAILTPPTVQIWMEFQAVMSQGCLWKVTKPQWPLVIRESLSCQPFKKRDSGGKALSVKVPEYSKSPKFPSKQWSKGKFPELENANGNFYFV